MEWIIDVLLLVVAPVLCSLGRGPRAETGTSRQEENIKRLEVMFDG